MKKNRIPVVMAIATTVLAGPLAGQGIAVAGRVSTLGIGGEASVGLTQTIALRGGLFLQPIEPKQTFDDIEYTLDLATPSYAAIVDLHPGGGTFRLSAGLVAFGSDNAVRARLTQPVEIGNRIYTPAEVGTLSGEFDTRSLAPYVGLGFGKMGGRQGLGFVLDLGVAFHGKPGVNLSATGPIASQPGFRADLEAEERNLEDDADAFRVYPVLSIGLVFGF